MKENQIESLVTENTTEGVTNWKNVSSAINSHVNEIRDNALDKFQGSEEFTNNIRANFLKENGFENVDQFNVFVKTAKSNTNEIQETNLRLTNELSDLQSKYTELNNQFTNSNNELTHIKNQKLANDLGVKSDMVDFALFEASKIVNDETSLEDVLESFKESRPAMFGDKPNLKVGKKINQKTEVKDATKEKLSAKYPWLK